MTRVTSAIRRIALTALALAGLAGCAPGRGFEALHLLVDLAGGPHPHDAPLDGAVRIAIDAEESGAAPADLYLPARGGGDAAEARPAEAALVLVPGLAPGGKEDARLVALAAALARVRIAALVPDLVSLRELRAGPDNIDEIAEALRYLEGPGRARWAGGMVDERRPVGVAAISYAVGPALLATIEPGLAGKVEFLVGVGGYHDLTATLTFVTTGWHRNAEGAWRRGSANPYGKWAFVHANASRVESAADRTTLAAMARRRLDDLHAPIDDLVAGLGREGQSVHALIDNADPERVPALIAALPAPIREDMAALDLAGRDLSAAPRNILLLHGSDDAIIPAGQSAELAAALGPDRAKLILLDSLAHADLGLDSLGDAWRLWRAAYWLLAVRDGVS